LLEKRVPLKRIAVEIGISKSSIHRHSKSCWIRARAQKIKAHRFDPSKRVIVEWPNDEAAPPQARGRFVIFYDPGEPEKSPLIFIDRRDTSRES